MSAKVLILATAPEHIGKEANRWEEQFFLGLDLETQTEYGTMPNDHERILDVVRQTSKKFGQRKLARAASVSLSEVSVVLLGKQQPNPTTLAKLYRAVPRMEREARRETEHVREVLDAIRERHQHSSVRQIAKLAQLDEANLAHVLSGRRKPSQLMLAKLEATLEQQPR